jgi:hypothetical protein
MSFDDFPCYDLYGSDDSFAPFENGLFDDQSAIADPLLSDVTESTTTFSSFTLTTPTSQLFSIQKSPETHSPFPASLSDSEWDGTSEVVTLKERVGIQERHHNLVKKGEGRDAKKDLWDNYLYDEGFFYGVLYKTEGKSPSAKLVFEVCKVLREQDRSGKDPFEPANRWAKRRMANAFAWLDRHKGKISTEEFLDCLREAKHRLNQ